MTPGDEKDALLAARDAIIAAMSGELAMAKQALADKDAHLASVVAAKDALLASKDNQHKAALRDKEAAQQMVRQLTDSLLDAQMTQTRMIKDLHLWTLPGKFIGVEMKKKGDGNWQSDHFYTEDGSHEKTKWYLWLWGSSEDPPVLVLRNWNSKGICASAICQVLGKKVEIEKHEFGRSRNGDSRKTDAPMPMSRDELNRLTEDLKSIEARIKITFYRSE